MGAGVDLCSPFKYHSFLIMFYISSLNITNSLKYLSN